MVTPSSEDKWAPFWICLGVFFFSVIFEATGLSKREWIPGSIKIGKWIMLFAAAVIGIRNLLF